MKNKFLLLIALFALSVDLMAQCGFFDGFESGTYSPTWSPAGGSYVFSATTSSPYAGTYRLEGVGGGNSSHFNGLVATMPSNTPDMIAWAIYTASSGTYSDYFVAGDADIISNSGVIFCYKTADDNIRFFTNTNVLNYAITPNTWYYIEAKNINWVAHTYDIYINGVLQFTGFPFRANSSSMDRIHLYNYDNATGVWDNIQVGSRLAAPSITASANSACAGTQVTLTANAAPGYTNAEYLWYKNGAAVNYQNGGPGTYVVNAGNVAGPNYYNLEVVYTGVGCTSALSATYTVTTISASSTVVPSGPTSFCANTPTTLNAPAGMITYAWKRSNVPVGTNSASYTPTASGNHCVTVTDANGCTKTSGWTNIIVKPIPTANAGVDKVQCEGSSIQIGSANNVANTYTWSPIDNLSNVFISNPMVSATGTVVYSVTVNNASTGCSNTDAMQITLLSLPPTPSLSSTPQGNLIHLTSNTPGATTVNWYKDGVALYANQAANSSINVYASNPQKAYTVKSKGANGCLSLASNSINVRLGPDKGRDLVIGEVGFTAYPNPTSGLLRVTIVGAMKDDGLLLLYNGLGQVVLRRDVFLMGGNGEMELDLEGLATGVYSLVYEGVVVKVVKE